jgi:hypothetical protein
MRLELRAPRATIFGSALLTVAIAWALAYEQVGPVGLLAVALPAAFVVVLDRHRIARLQTRVDEIESSNKELRRSNTDAYDLFEFASGLALYTHDTQELTSYVRAALKRLVGARVEMTVGCEPSEGATPLFSGDRVVGGLRVEGGDAERWAHLRRAIVPSLATVVESTTVSENVRKNHVEAIAGLSRSIDAKDGCSGGHTERVSRIAVGLARRLGYTGSDLDAIEIGALMHDIGKIGIPESILHKPGPLDNDEWIVMKRHPVISELILKEIDLSPIVTEIARSSHERMDGQGYPDGLKGEEIPLPARIVLVADAFDALTTDRPYRRARRPKAALDEIVANSSEQFCPKVVAALRQMYVDEPATLGEVQLTVVASA